MAQWNRRDRDRRDGQPVMTEQEMVARFLEEYQGGDTQEHGSEAEVMDRFMAAYRPSQHGNSLSDDVDDDHDDDDDEDDDDDDDTDYIEPLETP